HGPHTALLAARLAAEAAEHKQSITRVEMGRDGQIHAIERHYADDPGRRFGIDASNATTASIEASSQRWLAATSPHYLAQHPAAERSESHARALQALNPDDREMFSTLRGLTPAHVGDATVAEAMLHAKRNGIHDHTQLAGVVMTGEQLHILGTTPGIRTSFDVNAHPSPLLESIQQTQEVNQQRQQQLAQQEQQQSQQQSQARAMSLG
ncbi:MAG: hypothetical protein Q4G62_03665, partial [Pseudomonadota bacterium]|nr:hypothetical protein [Pseudomonadota bacterium]